MNEISKILWCISNKLVVNRKQNEQMLLTRTLTLMHTHTFRNLMINKFVEEINPMQKTIEEEKLMWTARDNKWSVWLMVMMMSCVRVKPNNKIALHKQIRFIWKKTEKCNGFYSMMGVHVYVWRAIFIGEFIVPSNLFLCTEYTRFLLLYIRNTKDFRFYPQLQQPQQQHRHQTFQKQMNKQFYFISSAKHDENTKTHTLYCLELNE